MRSPDVAWISNEKWASLSKEDRKGFANVCPQFVVELNSETDHLTQLREKMKEWMDNGCQLSWLINLNDQEVEIYRNAATPEILKGFERYINGENILPDFRFDLKMLKE